MQLYIRIALILSICCVTISPLVTINAFHPEIQPTTKTNSSTIQNLSIISNTLNNLIQLDVTFPEPQINENNCYQSVRMPGLQEYGNPGNPVLPLVTLKVVIPPGKKLINIDVTPANPKLLEGQYYVDYGRTPTPISMEPKEDKPNQKIYDSNQAFPEKLYSGVTYQYFRGFEIVHITLHPVQYFPKTGRLTYFETFIVQMDLDDSDSQHPLLRNMAEDIATVQELVDNPETIQIYDQDASPRKTSIVNSSESYDYVIITNAALNASFQPLIDWKIQKGLNATTVLVEDILNDPDYFCDGTFGDGCGSDFNDTAAKVRNFIKDAYLNWGTEYVLLGGDVGIIQHRGVYGFVATDPITQDQNMPCDLYFGALDGSWDNDNDTIFGEGVYSAESGSPQNGTAGDEADLYAEVYIGRAPVGGVTSVQNFVNKTIWYENTTDDNYLREAVMIGETLDEETDGSNSKDFVSSIIPQYTTKRLYERDNTYSSSAIRSTINNGVHILNHDGHCNVNSMMGMSKTDIDTLITNTDEFFFGYSVGCYAAAFDSDSVVEHFVRNPTGSFAFISNSRYGWYFPGTIAGPGERFDKAFFVVLNNTDNHIGKTLQLSKEIYASGSMANADRWTYFELNLLGDPETELVTEIEAPTAHFDTDPTASRLSPAVVKGVVNLTGIARKGTAPSTTFSNYTIDFYQSGGWTSTGITLMNNGQNEVTDDLLATWDTNIVTPGKKTLRLTVTDANGTIGEDKWVVQVEELPAVRVEPQLTETYEGLNFTVSVRITDPEDLYGLDLYLSWNTTFADYMNHEVYIPRDNYWWGVLYSPVQITANTVNVTSGTFHIAAHSTGWDPFENDGTVFNMTFNAKLNGTFNLEISLANLTNRDGQMLTHKIVDGVVLIEPGFHDAAVLDISPGKTVVGEGYQIKIYVTMANEGTFMDEFNITVLANSTFANMTQISLPALSEMVLTVYWHTSGFGKGNHTLSVQIEALDGEIDLSDNNYTATENVTVTIPGDVDATFKVDIFDIVRIVGSYLKTEADPDFDPICDIDDSGKINIFDVVIAANNYLESWP